MFQSIYRQTLLDERSFFAPHGRSALFRSGSPPLLFFPLLCQSFRRLSRRDGLAWADEEMKRGRSNHRHANGPPVSRVCTRVGVIKFAVDSNLSGKLMTSV